MLQPNPELSMNINLPPYSPYSTYLQSKFQLEVYFSSSDIA